MKSGFSFELEPNYFLKDQFHRSIHRSIVQESIIFVSKSKFQVHQAFSIEVTSLKNFSKIPKKHRKNHAVFLQECVESNCFYLVFGGCVRVVKVRNLHGLNTVIGLIHRPPKLNAYHMGKTGKRAIKKHIETMNRLSAILQRLHNKLTSIGKCGSIKLPIAKENIINSV